MASSESRTIVRGTFIVSVYTLLSRILGFIRDLLVARYFGAGVFADAFFVAFRIPNLLRSFVAEGALSSAFVPVFTERSQQGVEVADAVMRSVLTCVLILNVLLSIVGCVFAPQIVQLIAPGFADNPEQFSLCVTLTRVMIFYILFVSLVALVNGALNAFRVFGASAMAQVVMNLVLIAGALVAGRFNPLMGVHILAWSVLLGGFVQLVVQLPALRRVGLGLMPTLRIVKAPVVEIARLMGPALIGAAVYQLGIFIATILASFLQSGSVSWLFYADRVTQFPIGIFTIALASVLLPSLARSSQQANGAEFAEQLHNSLRYTTVFMIPAAVFLASFAEPVVALLFERGAFTERDTVMTAAAVATLSWALWPVSCHSMMVRAFMAKKDTTTPTLLGVCGVVVTVLLSLILMGPVDGATVAAKMIATTQQFLAPLVPMTDMAHVGLAAASAGGSLFVLIATGLLLSRRVPVQEWLPQRALLHSIVGSCVCVIALRALPLPDPALLRIGVGGAVFLMLYALVLLGLGNREMKETFSLISRKH